MPKSPIKSTSKGRSQSKASLEKHPAQVLMDSHTMGWVLEKLSTCYDFHPMGELTQNDPYKVLVACVLSLRTKDEVTMPASERLFALADTPEKMVRLTPETVEKLIFPVGFYKTKARSIIEFSQKLLNDFSGRVPDTIDELLTLKGVGRKTANLVVGLGHQLPAICVDVHVHRICNRLGYIQTKTPEETEMVLREKLPEPYWKVLNTILVLHGQAICKPISPHCDVCPVSEWCQQVNVKPRILKTSLKRG